MRSRFVNWCKNLAGGLCFFNFTIDWVCDTIYTINLCYTTLDFLQLDCFLICVMWIKNVFRLESNMDNSQNSDNGYNKGRQSDNNNSGNYNQGLIMLIITLGNLIMDMEIKIQMVMDIIMVSLTTVIITIMDIIQTILTMGTIMEINLIMVIIILTVSLIIKSLRTSLVFSRWYLVLLLYLLLCFTLWVFRLLLQLLFWLFFHEVGLVDFKELLLQGFVLVYVESVLDFFSLLLCLLCFLIQIL